METTVVPLGFASGGARGELHPFLLNEESFQRATNVRLHKRMARTAHGWECVPISGKDTDLLLWRRGNTQGAWYFNPASGQSAIRFAEESAQILHSVAGQLFRLRPTRRNGRFALILEDASGGLRSSATVQMAWGEGAEYYFIKTDGVGKTMIVDGRDNSTRWSTGYSSIAKDDSSLPNNAGPVRYVHSRIHIGVRMNGMNAIIVGDPVHRTNFSDAANVLATTEQVYLNTGLFLAPPSGMGAVIALEILPLQDEAHGHGELIAFCPTPGGTWSANTNLWPRSKWGEEAFSKHAILNAAAAGPHAHCHWDGDIAFRSRKGIQSLRSARAERGQPGSPYHDLAGPVRYVMSGDFDELLRFASMARHEKKQRIFCTVRNFSRGIFRWHRGFVTACQDPEEGVSRDGQDLGAWEGLRCLPPEAGGPIQFVSGIFSGREELFAICWNHRRQRHTVWRYRPEVEYDRLEDGTEYPIQSRLITRQIAGSMFHAPQGDWLHLLAEDIVGDLTWEVLWRKTGGTWKRIGARHESCAAGNPEDGPRSVGPFPAVDPGRRIEFMVRWQGAASVMLRYGAKPASPMGESTNIKSCQTCATDDDDFEYNNGSDWAANIIDLCRPPNT